ncbi:MAG: hypothetical protein ACREPR_02515, partial [Brasilonema sp.]
TRGEFILFSIETLIIFCTFDKKFIKAELPILQNMFVRSVPKGHTKRQRSEAIPYLAIASLHYVAYALRARCAKGDPNKKMPNLQ